MQYEYRLNVLRYFEREKQRYRFVNYICNTRYNFQKYSKHDNDWWERRIFGSRKRLHASDDKHASDDETHDELHDEWNVPDEYFTDDEYFIEAEITD